MAAPLTVVDVSRIQGGGKKAWKKVADAVNKGVGLDPMESIVSRLTAPPGSPTDADRHLIIATATGVWAGREDDIAEWDADAGSWVYTTPTEGGTFWDETLDKTYIYDGSAWVVGGSSTVPITDPGDAGAIPVVPVTQMSAYVALTSGGAGETRTLAIPAGLGQRLQLFVDTDGGGDIVITVASAVDQAGSTIITMGDAGDFIELVSMSVGGTNAWRIAANIGCALT